MCKRAPEGVWLASGAMLAPRAGRCESPSGPLMFRVKFRAFELLLYRKAVVHAQYALDLLGILLGELFLGIRRDAAV